MKYSRIAVAFLSLAISACSNLSTSAPKTYSITYFANGATSGEVPAKQLKTEGIDLVIAANTGDLARAGYNFLCWNDSSLGNGSDCLPGGVYSGNADLALFAKWTDIPVYSVNYSSYGSTGGTAPPPQIKTHDVDLTLSSNSGSLIREDYTFGGWNTSVMGTGTDYAEGGTYSTNAYVMLYPKWVPITYRLTYDATGSTGGSPPVDAADYVRYGNATVQGTGSLVNSSNGGNQLAGWMTKPDGTGTSYAVGSKITIATSDVTLYPVWVSNAFSISAVNNEIKITGAYSPPVGALAIPEGVTSFTFYASVNLAGLTSVVIPGSLKDISLYGFDGASNLSSIDFASPSGLLGIEYYAFAGTAFTSFEIPSGVTYLGYGTFSNMPNLASIVIPGSVSAINGREFSGDGNLTSITLLAATPPTLSADNVFSGCPASLKIHVPAGALEAYQCAPGWSLLTIVTP